MSEDVNTTRWTHAIGIIEEDEEEFSKEEEEYYIQHGRRNSMGRRRKLDGDGAKRLLHELSSKEFGLKSKLQRKLVLSHLSQVREPSEMFALVFSGAIPILVDIIHTYKGKLEPAMFSHISQTLIRFVICPKPTVQAKVFEDANLLFQLFHTTQDATLRLAKYDVDEANNKRSGEWVQLISEWQTLILLLMQSPLNIERLTSIEQFGEILDIVHDSYQTVVARYMNKAQHEADLFCSMCAILAKEHDICTQLLSHKEGLIFQTLGTILKTIRDINVSHTISNTYISVMINSASKQYLTNQHYVTVASAVQAQLTLFLIPGLSRHRRQSKSGNVKDELSLEQQLDNATITYPRNHDEFTTWLNTLEQFLQILALSTTQKKVIMEVFKNTHQNDDPVDSINALWKAIKLLDLHFSFNAKENAHKISVARKMMVLRTLHHIYEHSSIQQSHMSGESTVLYFGSHFKVLLTTISSIRDYISDFPESSEPGRKTIETITETNANILEDGEPGSTISSKNPTVQRESANNETNSAEQRESTNNESNPAEQRESTNNESNPAEQRESTNNETNPAEQRESINNETNPAEQRETPHMPNCRKTFQNTKASVFYERCLKTCMNTLRWLLRLWHHLSATRRYSVASGSSEATKEATQISGSSIEKLGILLKQIVFSPFRISDENTQMIIDILILASEKQHDLGLNFTMKELLNILASAVSRNKYKIAVIVTEKIGENLTTSTVFANHLIKSSFCMQVQTCFSRILQVISSETEQLMPADKLQVCWNLEMVKCFELLLQQNVNEVVTLVSSWKVSITSVFLRIAHGLHRIKGDLPSIFLELHAPKLKRQQKEQIQFRPKMNSGDLINYFVLFTPREEEIIHDQTNTSPEMQQTNRLEELLNVSMTTLLEQLERKMLGCVVTMAKKKHVLYNGVCKYGLVSVQEHAETPMDSMFAVLLAKVYEETISESDTWNVKHMEIILSLLTAIFDCNKSKLSKAFVYVDQQHQLEYPLGNAFVKALKLFQQSLNSKSKEATSNCSILGKIGYLFYFIVGDSKYKEYFKVQLVAQIVPFVYSIIRQCIATETDWMYHGTIALLLSIIRQLALCHSNTRSILLDGTNINITLLVFQQNLLLLKQDPTVTERATSYGIEPIMCQQLLISITETYRVIAHTKNIGSQLVHLTCESLTMIGTILDSLNTYIDMVQRKQNLNSKALSSLLGLAYAFISAKELPFETKGHLISALLQVLGQIAKGDISKDMGKICEQVMEILSLAPKFERKELMKCREKVFHCSVGAGVISSDTLNELRIPRLEKLGNSKTANVRANFIHTGKKYVLNKLKEEHIGIPESSENEESSSVDTLLELVEKEMQWKIASEEWKNREEAIEQKRNEVCVEGVMKHRREKWYQIKLDNGIQMDKNEYRKDEINPWIDVIKTKGILDMENKRKRFDTIARMVLDTEYVSDEKKS